MVAIELIALFMAPLFVFATAVLFVITSFGR